MDSPEQPGNPPAFMHSCATQNVVRHKGETSGLLRVKAQTGATRTETRYGCYLPVLTGLARRSSTPACPPYIAIKSLHGKARIQIAFC